MNILGLFGCVLLNIWEINFVINLIFWGLIYTNYLKIIKLPRIAGIRKRTFSCTFFKIVFLILTYRNGLHVNGISIQSVSLICFNYVPWWIFLFFNLVLISYSYIYPSTSIYTLFPCKCTYSNSLRSCITKDIL